MLYAYVVDDEPRQDLRHLDVVEGGSRSQIL